MVLMYYRISYAAVLVTTKAWGEMLKTRRQTIMHSRDGSSGFSEYEEEKIDPHLLCQVQA